MSKLNYQTVINNKQIIFAWALLVVIVSIIFYMYGAAAKSATVILPDQTAVMDAPITKDIAITGKFVIADDVEKSVVEYFMANNEPSIKDATWSDSKQPTLFLGVIDNGSNRDGLADYACQVLTSDFGIHQGSVHVYIMDIEKIAKGGKWVRLGESRCT